MDTQLDNQFTEVVRLIEVSRQRAYHAVNTTLIELYWNVGEYIHHKTETDAWGKGTVKALASYIQLQQPGMRGFFPQNIWRMRQFFEAYRNESKLSPLVRVLPWTHNLIILGQSKRAEEREFYLRLAIQEKWGKRELERQFKTALFERTVTQPVKVSTTLRELQGPSNLYILTRAKEFETRLVL